MKKLLAYPISIKRIAGILTGVVLTGSIVACGSPSAMDTSETASETPAESTPTESSTESSAEDSAPSTPSPSQTPEAESSPPPTVTPDAETEQAASLTTATEEQTVEIYWLKGDDTIVLAPTPMTLKADSNDPSAVLKAAFEQLLSQPDDSELYSVIPNGTQLQELTLKNDGVYLDLSSEFTSGGGSAAVNGRLAQVVYTATSLNSGDSVWISVDGQPLEVIQGEGIEVPQPLTRQLIEEEFPF